MKCPNELIVLGERLARAAGVVIARHYRTRIDVETKPDDSPVTIADRDAETAIRTILASERPNDGIIGEEFGAERTDAEFVWVLDPIDGTRAFITGRPTFGTLIACTHGGRPIFGMIYQPITQDLWVGAQGHPTRHNGEVAKTRPCPALSSAWLSTTTPDVMTGTLAAGYSALRDAARETYYGGDCFAYGLLASGFVDVVVDTTMQLYDYAALVPVVEGAGGVVTDWSGQTLTGTTDVDVLAVGDPARLPDIVDLLATR